MKYVEASQAEIYCNKHAIEGYFILPQQVIRVVNNNPYR